VDDDAGRSGDNKLMDWPSRYKIGAARGISYLHLDCIPPHNSPRYQVK